MHEAGTNGPFWMIGFGFSSGPLGAWGAGVGEVKAVAGAGTGYEEQAAFALEVLGVG